jgi:hypothetical protein
LGGLIFAAYVVFHPLRDGSSIASTGVVYGAIHNIGVFGLIFQLLGLIGLYIQEADALGRRGLNSFIVVFIGQVLYICLTVVDGLRNPLLAKYAPATVHTFADNDPNMLAIVLPALLIFFLGYLLFGSSLLSAKVRPRLGSLLLMLGGPVYIIGGINIFILGPASPLVSLIEITGAIPFAIGYILWGLKLRASMSKQVGLTSISE